MRLALLTDGVFPHVVGGIQKHSAHLARYLARAGAEVELHHLPGDDPEGAAALAGFDEADRARIDSRLSTWPSRLRLPGHYLRESRAHSEALLRDVRPRLADLDCIYAQGLTGLAFTRARARGELQLPVVVNPHGLNPFQRTGTWREAAEARMLRGIVAESVRGADLVVSMGGELTRILERLGLPDERIVELPNAVEASWLVKTPHETSTPRRFLFVGRYQRLKGVEELERVLPFLLAERDFRFDFVGPIPEALKLAHESVRYHGLVRDSSRVQDLMRQSDVLVCPSWSEGMPTVILEAMASGLAVIATDVGAVSGLVDESNGRLLQAGQAAALGVALRDLIDIPEEALQAMGSASLERVRARFLWEAVAADTLAALESLV